MKKIILSGIFLTLISAGSPLFAEIYSWTDEHGNIVYGDQPDKKDKAEAVELNEPTVLNFPAVDTSKLDEEEEVEEEYSYQSIVITSPQDEGTIRENNGNVQVQLDIQPQLFDGHSVHIYLDGSAKASAAKNTVMLKNVDRGSHTVSAKIIDAEGEVLLESESNSFHLHRFFNKPSK